jgi:hypothetical protein
MFDTKTSKFASCDFDGRIWRHLNKKILTLLEHEKKEPIMIGIDVYY